MTSLALPHAERRFFATPVPERDIEPDDAPRRIWELDEGTLFVALGVLIEPGELRALVLEAGGPEARGSRDALLLGDAVRRCARRCAFAEKLEALLEVRTRGARQGAHGSPLAELASLWLGARTTADGRQLTALLWCLARDRRWLVRPLFDMVRGDVWVRALRLLAGAGSMSLDADPVAS
jgi:hypothetical protein